jgi:ACS family tartrate transporter-like MFS transporter
MQQLLHKIGARIWIARILISWVAMATLTASCNRCINSTCCASCSGWPKQDMCQGVYLYLNYWFPKREQARAIAGFLFGLPVASILGASLSGYILDHVHWFGWGSWRWLLLLEGLPPILFGILTYFCLPSRPMEATFLSEVRAGRRELE